MKLFGKNSVIERLRSNPSSIIKIFIEQGYKDSAYIHKKAKQRNIPIFVVPSSKMRKVGRDKNTQGVIIDVENFPYVLYEDLIQTALKKKVCLVFLDGLNDPQNLGAIMRSLGCLGKFAIVLPTHDSVHVNETVVRVASGGDNYVPVAQVSNLNKAIQQAKEAGFWIAGSVVKDGKSLYEAELSFPLGLVVGSEQKGVRQSVQKNLDLEITIPMPVHTLSLNVAHATSIICYEIKRQSFNKSRR